MKQTQMLNTGLAPVLGVYKAPVLLVKLNQQIYFKYWI